MRSFRLGLIGCGHYGQNLARFVGKVDGLTLAAAADPCRKKLDAVRGLFPGCAAYPDGLALIAAGCVDAVIIATPNDLHAGLAIRAMERGLHVYLEKPVACAPGDAALVRAAQQRTRAKAMVGMQLRYGAVFTGAKALLDDGAIGDVRLVWYREFRGPFLPGEGGWRTQPERSGGSIVEKCVHHFDLFNWYVASRPAAVFASAGADDVYRGTGMLDNAVITVEYANGARAGLGLTLFSEGCGAEVDFMLAGARGVMMLRQDRIIVRPNGGGEVVRAVEQPFREMGHGGTEYSALCAFYRLLALGEAPMTGLREGALADEMAMAAQRSAKEGRKIPLDGTHFFEEEQK